MGAQAINANIDKKIIDINDRTNKSVEVRRNFNDNYMKERLEKFDKLCLNSKEQEQITMLNEAELLQFKESRKYALKSAWGGVRVATGGIIGKSLGVVGAADNAQRYTDSEDMLSRISDTRNIIRAKAQSRYEKATGLTVNINKTAEEGYDYGK